MPSISKTNRSKDTLLKATPVSEMSFMGHNFFVKRDETISKYFSGNKYRKLQSLIDTPSKKYDRLVSYGGTQSNAMLSIAALCNQKGWAFDYYTRPISQGLKNSPSGNLKIALDLGMNIIEDLNYQNNVKSLPVRETTLIIPQGGADPIAEAGVLALAEEIRLWKKKNNIDKINIVTPSGTGTTSYYLAKHIDDIVYTTAAVGNNDFLIEQMRLLGDIPNNLVMLESLKKYRFANLYPEFLDMYNNLKKSGIEFDLIYAPLMWSTLMLNIDQINGPIMYVHSGGLIGNDSMLDRYTRKYNLG